MLDYKGYNKIVDRIRNYVNQLGILEEKIFSKCPVNYFVYFSIINELSEKEK